MADVGRFSELKKATPETQRLCDEVKDKAEYTTGKNFDEFRAVEYQEQVVDGMNYHIKVDVGVGPRITLKIFQALPCDGGWVELTAVEQYPTDVPGGLTRPRKATQETQHMCDEVKDKAEYTTGKHYDEFRAVEYQSQVVAGINYRIKVDVGGGQIITLTIFQALPCEGGTLTLTAVEQ